MRYAKVLCAFLGSVLAAACSMGGGANAARVVTGTITVPDNTYWANMKLGVFSGGALGTYTNLDVSNTSSTDGGYRITNNASGDITPVSGSSYTISDTSATSSAYSFELPAAVPQFQSSTTLERYYWAAWYDGDANSMLKLSTTGTGEEFNRCARKATTDTNGNPATITMQYFLQSYDNNQNPTGNYKYHGVDSTIPYTEQLELDASNNSGFNFTISAQSGW